MLKNGVFCDKGAMGGSRMPAGLHYPFGVKLKPLHTPLPSPCLVLIFSANPLPPQHNSKQGKRCQGQVFADLERQWIEAELHNMFTWRQVDAP